uniref:RING-type domain-containing protein n=1 Tax=Panagrolaimus sp. PS1159 TaxID=55785 RepID=A0AC35ERL0_9BILA
MDPAKWCLMGLEESLHSIDAAQKLQEKNPRDPQIFVNIKKNVIDIFRGLTDRVMTQFDLQNSKLKQIHAAVNSRPNMSPAELSANLEHVKIENKELRLALEHAEHRIAGYEKDKKTSDDKIKHLAADSAHSKCEQCKTRPRDVLFLPCRHFFICEECSNDLRKCPYCDKVIEESIIAEY